MKLIASEAMKKVDTKAIGEMGIPEAVLIENAGRAVADAAADLMGDPREKRVILLIGKGNNGGDGLAAARFLLKRGALVTLVLAEAPESFGPGAALQYKICQSFPFTILRWEKDQNEVLQACAQADLFIDALLGTSFHGKVREPIRSLLETLQMVPVPVLAVDIPSGVEADHGYTDLALHARATVTMIAPKPGLYLYPGAGYTGKIILADLNTPPSLVLEAESNAELLTEDLVRHVLPKRPPNAHKGMNGRVGILAGSLGYAGAAELCSKAAVRAGAANPSDARPGQKSLQKKIFTPHPGEMARLLGKSTGEILQDPVRAALEGAARWQAVVVLKCTPVVVALPNGQVFINTTGNEGMATGGCGDVLTGTIAALLGQGLDLGQAACCGVYPRGLAGDPAAAGGRIGPAGGGLGSHRPAALDKVKKR